MTAYYNEHDPQKAAWIRELIKAKVVAPGEVDERSITDVQPDDLRGFKQCHFFAGIGVWSYALRLAGWADDRECWTGSCPCPSFSAAGKGQGFDDPRHLWPDWIRLARVRRPPVIFGEQVAAAIGHGWLDLVQADLEAADYAVGKAVLGACSVGAPHIRQRLYFVGAHAEHAQRGPKLQEHGNAHGRDGLGWSGDTGSGSESSDTERRSNLLGDGRNRPDGGRTEAHGESRAYGEVRDGSDSTGERCDSEREGLEGHGRLIAEHDPQGWQEPVRRAAAASHATRGFWADCDWWYGRDGKYRPIKCGVQPLVARPSGDIRLLRDGREEPETTQARVLRLRGYGDSIVAQVAAEFIQGCMETI